MTPFSFEWQWNIGYFFFMGFLYLVIAIIACGLAIAYIRTWLSLQEGDGPEAGLSALSSRKTYQDMKNKA